MTRKCHGRRADDYAWHAAKIRKGIQQLGAVHMTLDAARTEWGCKIIAASHWCCGSTATIINGRWGAGMTPMNDPSSGRADVK